MKNKKEFTVECKICGRRYNNWAGSTPCCGSIAFIVENNQVTDKIVIYMFADENDDQK